MFVQAFYSTISFASWLFVYCQYIKSELAKVSQIAPYLLLFVLVFDISGVRRFSKLCISLILLPRLQLFSSLFTFYQKQQSMSMTALPENLEKNNTF